MPSLMGTQPTFDCQSMEGLVKRSPFLVAGQTTGPLKGFTDKQKDARGFQRINSKGEERISQLFFQNESTGGSDCEIGSCSTCSASVYSSENEGSRVCLTQVWPEGDPPSDTLSQRSSLTTLDSDRSLKTVCAIDGLRRGRYGIQNSSSRDLSEKPEADRKQKAENRSKRAHLMIKSLKHQQEQILYVCAVTLTFIVALLAIIANNFISAWESESTNICTAPSLEELARCLKIMKNNGKLPKASDVVYGHFQIHQGSDNITLTLETSIRYNPSELTWRKGVGKASDHIVIRTPGLYYVYSQVTFLPNGPGCAEHSIGLQPDGKDLLMKTVVELCNRMVPSSLSSLVWLNQSDNVYVYVNQTISVSRAKPSSFVGVFRLPNSTMAGSSLCNVDCG